MESNGELKKIDIGDIIKLKILTSVIFYKMKNHTKIFRFIKFNTRLCSMSLCNMFHKIMDALEFMMELDI